MLLFLVFFKLSKKLETVSLGFKYFNFSKKRHEVIKLCLRTLYQMCEDDKCQWSVFVFTLNIASLNVTVLFNRNAT